jgi:hypothetical protein
MRRCAVLALLAGALLAGCGGKDEPKSATRPCEPSISEGVLPTWARTGFSDPRPKMPHAVGRSKDIAALLFDYPLQAPADKTHGNKILWVSRVAVHTAEDLRISAQRMEGSRPLGDPVMRIVAGGPGPSTTDMPRAGCWRMTLRWGSNEDLLDLDYERQGRR